MEKCLQQIAIVGVQNTVTASLNRLYAVNFVRPLHTFTRKCESSPNGKRVIYLYDVRVYTHFGIAINAIKFSHTHFIQVSWLVSMYVIGTSTLLRLYME